MTKNRKTEVFHAFERLVARFGLDKVTMQELAREAGVSVGAIYLDYKNKDELIAAIEDKWKGHVAIRNERIVAGDGSPREKLNDIIVAHVIAFSSMIRENRAAFELLMGAIRLRYINRSLADTRREVFELMIVSTALVMKEGCAQGVFEIEKPEWTARLFVEAFADCFSAPEVIKREHAEVVKKAQGMFELLMAAIEKA